MYVLKVNFGNDDSEKPAAKSSRVLFRFFMLPEAGLKLQPLTDIDETKHTQTHLHFA